MGRGIFLEGQKAASAAKRVKFVHKKSATDTRHLAQQVLSHPKLLKVLAIFEKHRNF